MNKTLKLRTYRCGDAPKRGEGLRIGTTRRPPRGVPRSRWQRENYFDVWFPVVAPSEGLVRRFLHGDSMTYQKFCASYERELMGRAESRQALELLAALARRTPISVGCYCEDESRCHRAHLRKLIERASKGDAT
jgi:uncharacterized protein YeaO (DUF488 family)